MAWLRLSRKTNNFEKRSYAIKISRYSHKHFTRGYERRIQIGAIDHQIPRDFEPIRRLSISIFQSVSEVGAVAEFLTSLPIPTFSMSSIDAVLFDADGCLWAGPQPVPGAAEALHSLRANGIRCCVVTNNTSSMGKKPSTSQSVQDEIVMSPWCLTAQILLLNGFQDRNRRVFVVGEPSLIDELQAHGINACGDSEFDPNLSIGQLQIPTAFQAVVAAVDQSLTYRKLAIASRIILENQALFLGTNCDELNQAGQRVILPGSLTSIMAVEASTGKKAMMLGKLTQHMFEPLKRVAGISPENTMMVGDSLNTDMKFAKAIGAKGTVVLSGLTTMAEVGDEPENRPDYVCRSVAEVADIVLKENARTRAA
jgi:HAD superfamily hydrolase (TIGR01450 family)